MIVAFTVEITRSHQAFSKLRVLEADFGAGCDGEEIPLRTAEPTDRCNDLARAREWEDESAMRESEEQLGAWMVGGLDGDAASQAALLRALVPLLRAFFGRRVAGGDADVEDLVQETLIAVHTRRATYDRDRRFTSWLFAIARHKMIDHFRRTRRFCSIEGLEEMLVAEGFESSSNAQMDVERLLGDLPAKQARAIRRTRIDGLSTAEAAHDAGIGESDVKVSVHRGLKALAARVLGHDR